MKKYTFSTLVLLIIVLLGSCKKETKPKVYLGNPNGDSELALLMRQMYDETQKIKQGESSMALNFSPESIFTAQATDPKKAASEQYKVLGTAYVNSVKNYHKAADTDRDQAYEQMIGACENCHQALCPGPLVKVKKLYK